MKRNLGNGLEVWWINTNKKKKKGKSLCYEAALRSTQPREPWLLIRLYVYHAKRGFHASSVLASIRITELFSWCGVARFGYPVTHQDTRDSNPCFGEDKDTGPTLCCKEP
jgi:hypothetical protein